MSLVAKEKKTVRLLNRSGQAVADLTVKRSAAEAEAGKQVVHDYVVFVQNSARAWSASTKTRGDVDATGAKPWRQKGTGRARAGSLVSPLFRGGGVAFGPKPKIIRARFPKRMKKLVFEHALGEKIRQDKLLVVDEISLDSPKTKAVAETLKNLNASGKVLVITEKIEKNTLLSTRNIPLLTLRSIGDVSAYDILSHEILVLTKASFDSLGLGEE